ncbi:hypothetical protein Trydic_g9378 [Trypoxylus dichotomus]
MLLSYSLVCGLILVKHAYCVNILYVDPVASPSHHIWNEVLVSGLLEKGHNVTLIGHYDIRINSENYTLLKIEGVDAIYANMDISDKVTTVKSSVMKLREIWDFITAFVDLDLNSSALEKLLEYPRNHFDLIIFDITSGQYLYPLIQYFEKPPVMAVAPIGLPPYILGAMGSHFYSYYPIYVTPYTDKMSFSQIVENFFLYTADFVFRNYYTASMKISATDRFGKDIVNFGEAERQIGILLANYDPVTDFPQPLPPYIIPVGGLHVHRATNMSSKLQMILDKAPYGVIFFSLGTNVKSTWLTAETKKSILLAFRKLKQIVLWKYDGEDLKGIPENVIIEKWFSQNEILSHKNVELFISHCGGLSVKEAIYHGVPVVGMPIFLDQKAHAIRMEYKGLGRYLEVETMTSDSLYEAIQEVLNNPKYSQNMHKTSLAFRDWKETPLQRALFWVEYVLRHKNVNFLSTSSREMNFFQRQNLDIILFLLLCSFAFVLTIKQIVPALFNVARFVIRKYKHRIRYTA